MVPVVFALMAAFAAAFLLRRVLKMLIWLAIAAVVGIAIPAAVLGVLFLVTHVVGVH